MFKRWLSFIPAAALALAVLAACGGEEPAEEEVVDAPAGEVVEDEEAPADDAEVAEDEADAPAEDAATDVTLVPATAADPAEADVTLVPATAADPAETGAAGATPAAGGAATPTTGGGGAAATPVAGAAASPVAGAAATPVGGGAMASPVAVGATPIVLGGTPAAGATPAGGVGAVAGSDAAAQEFAVTSFDIYFEPKELTIPANQDVVVSLPNEGAAPHNFSIDALDISIDQAPGAQEETTINAAPGEYEYYCNVPGHREAGMVGTLTVE